ncbi:MAG: HAMP domain-containing histidine kinase [Actinomycetota bacterium]|nr:MAG: HAMP domain-containing histidine kinase [Actinomycetota bacterium]
MDRLRPPAAVRTAWSSVQGVFRRSLQLRVITTTLLVSAVVVGLLGALLLSRVTSGLLEAKERSALAEASAGRNEAQRLLDAADTGTTTPSPVRLIDSVAATLAARAGTPGLFDILVLASAPTAAEAPERGTNLVSEDSVPGQLRQAVAGSQRQSWTYHEIRYVDGRTVPGLVVGQPVAVPTVGAYELYYLFPLNQEQSTLDLVRSTVFGTAALLVVGLGLLALFVTRQVVSPVRQAAQVAQRVSEGNLSDRMRVQGEDDLAVLATSFNEMAQSLEEQINRLEELSRVQQRFVSDVSHELRTPLTTVRMAADVIYEARERFDPSTARSAELLQNQLDRFESLLADLLEISRFDAGAAVLDVDNVDVRDLARRVVEETAPLAERRGAVVRLQLPAGECVVSCDSRRVDRILRNLVVNAIEHGEGAAVRITVGADASAVAVTVRDAGVGLKPGESSLVFNRFWRGDPARARTTGGTGLGLAIALEDARLHGGWLEAWGAPGEGSLFRLTLPRDASVTLDRSPLPLQPGDVDESARAALVSPYGGRPSDAARGPADRSVAAGAVAAGSGAPGDEVAGNALPGDALPGDVVAGSGVGENIAGGTVAADDAADTVALEAPAVDALAVDALAVDALAVEAPAVDAPAVDAPAPDAVAEDRSGEHRPLSPSGSRTSGGRP